MKTVGEADQEAQASSLAQVGLPVSSDPAASGRSPDAPAASAAGSTVPAGVGEDREGTRNRVARLILANGSVTAADLAVRLGLTSAGVRRHLDALLAEGLVEAREQRVYGQRGQIGRAHV